MKKKNKLNTVVDIQKRLKDHSRLTISKSHQNVKDPENFC